MSSVVSLALATLMNCALQTALFRSEVSLVPVDVLATEDGVPIAGLRLSDFEIRDNGVLQTPKVLYGEEQPLDIILVLDRSGSLAGERLRHLKRAAHAVIGQLKAEDRAAILSVADDQRLSLGFSADKQELAAAVDRLVAGGGTVARDAAYGALCLSANTGRRTLIVLFSDGIDNRSWLSRADVVGAFRQSDPVVTTVAFEGAAGPVDGRPKGAIGLSLFNELSRDTGGETVVVKRATELEAVFLDVLKRMRARYLLAYTPVGVERSGWHTLSVRLRGRSGTALARRGYYARAK